MLSELEVLGRAHALFTGGMEAGEFLVRRGDRAGHTGRLPAAYLVRAGSMASDLDEARGTDSELARLLRRVQTDHAEAKRQTAAVLAAARTDASSWPDNPIAQRELLRRRIARVRMQRRHVLSARRRARRRLDELLAMRYGQEPRGRTSSRAAKAVRAALSRLGRPYVWGATGPDRFDCSGLVQWAYAQAGMRLDRTTYDQINDGVPVPRSRIRPGDLVFPHAGHVQMAIGGNRVVEAPYSGATVRISPLGEHVVIRRVAAG